MNEQELFSKNIEELTQFARVNNNQINLSDVDDMFREMNLDEKQMELIYSYLKLNKIKVMKDGEEYERKEWEYEDKNEQDTLYDEKDEEDEDEDGEERHPLARRESHTADARFASPFVAGASTS